MATILAPGVVVEEKRSLGKAATPANTSIPLFIGHTERGSTEPRRIRSMEEYEVHFGKAHPFIQIALNGGALHPLSNVIHPTHTLYYALQLFFANGGEVCWVASVGGYLPNVDQMPPLQAPVDYTKLVPKISVQAALDASLSIEEISLVCVPEVPCIPNDKAAVRGDVINAVMTHCGTLGSRFAIVDEYARAGDDIASFRNLVQNSFMSYGAAYYPQVGYGLGVPDSAVIVMEQSLFGATGINLDKALAEGQTNVTAQATTIRNTASRLFNLYVGTCGAVAAQYGVTDRNRGVWKAPAGMTLAGCTKPFIGWQAYDDGPLYDGSGNGKDVNRIRLAGNYGAQVWGARTLAGNDLDYRYIPVRRLMTYIGQTLKRSTSYAVFQANNANTWTELRNMCEGLLNDLWRQGALMGAKPSEAYQVRIGLGQSMNADDVLQGRLKIMIAVAPVRPAEFVSISFSHFVNPA
ncbi:MAG: phage tail sheath C-terminal domain-containing protein [Bacteroidia bacterium]